MTTMTSPASVKISAQPPLLHRRNRCPILSTSKKNILPPPPCFCDLSPPVDILKMITANLRIFYVALISSLFISFSQIALRPTSMFLLVLPVKTLTTARNHNIAFLFHQVGYRCHHLHLQCSGFRGLNNFSRMLLSRQRQFVVFR